MLWLGVALATTVLVVSNFQSQRKLSSAQTELSLQNMQIEFLEAALESESTLVEASLTELRHSLQATKISATAILRYQDAPTEPVAVVIWADQSVSGQLIFLSPLAASSEIEGMVFSQTPPSSDHLSFVATNSNQVLGITSTNPDLLSHNVRIGIHSSDRKKDVRYLVGEFKR